MFTSKLVYRRETWQSLCWREGGLMENDCSRSYNKVILLLWYCIQLNQQTRLSGSHHRKRACALVSIVEGWGGRKTSGRHPKRARMLVFNGGEVVGAENKRPPSKTDARFQWWWWQKSSHHRTRVYACARFRCQLHFQRSKEGTTWPVGSKRCQ